MKVPTSIAIRSFSDRAEALSHCILRAGEAPRLVAYDDTVGCPTETILAALEWTRIVGILQDDDLLHAGRLTTDTAAAVVERRDQEHAPWVFLGPRLEDPQFEAPSGELLIDEPGLRAVAFPERALALAHFLATTLGAGAMLAQLGRRAPETRHVRRWIGPIVSELDRPRRWMAGWFAVTAAGALFVGDEEGETRYRYIEVGSGQ